MEFPFVEVLEIGGWCRDCTHAARRLTRFSGPGHYCSANHPKWSGWQELHLRPPRSEQGRLLLTLHPEIGCQGWTRTNTVRFNKPSCYFDTKGGGCLHDSAQRGRGESLCVFVKTSVLLLKAFKVTDTLGEPDQPFVVHLNCPKCCDLSIVS